jgi:WD40 repeat protein
MVLKYLFLIRNIPWPGTDKLISSSFDYSLKIWDAVRGCLLHSLERHKDAVTKFSLSRWILLGSYSGWY